MLNRQRGVTSENLPLMMTGGIEWEVAYSRLGHDQHSQGSRNLSLEIIIRLLTPKKKNPHPTHAYMEGL